MTAMDTTTSNLYADHVKKTTPLEISLCELCQNPIVLERENFKMQAVDTLLLYYVMLLF